MFWIADWRKQVRQREPLGAKRIVEQKADPVLGESLRIESWGADRTTCIRYCGQPWRARLRDGSSSEPGMFRVSEIGSDYLVLEKS